MNLDLDQIKMEDINGERMVEREHVAYVEVPNFDWVHDAKQFELHEQWNIDYAKSSRVRGRLRLINNRRHTEAVKQPLMGEEGYYECEQDISPDMYEMKKLACTTGYLKERYIFPAGDNGLMWEVDVFKSRSGGRHHWVKVDLEYNSIHDEIPEFPFDIVGNPIIVERVMSAQVEEFIDNLWDKEWLKLEHSSAKPTGPLE